MGGFGSGRWCRYGTKRTTSGSLPLDIRALQRKGLLKPGSVFQSRWSRGDNPEDGASISGIVSTDRVTLMYRRRPHGGEWEDVEEPVRIAWTPCHFGGRRAWWLCPSCGRRAAVLYAPARLFLCRLCYRLAYPSQNADPIDRAHDKALALRRRAGGGGRIDELFPKKPKGMHWRTYDRLLWEYVAATEMWEEALHAELLRIANRFPRTSQDPSPDFPSHPEP